MQVDQMEAKMIANLEANTDKPIEEWIAIARGSKLTKHKEILNYLKSEYGLSYGYANLIATKARQPEGASPPTGNDLIDAQYAGAKADLRPIYDAISNTVYGRGWGSLPGRLLGKKETIGERENGEAKDNRPRALPFEARCSSNLFNNPALYRRLRRTERSRRFGGWRTAP